MEQKLIQKQFQKLLFTQTMQESMQILQMPLLELKMLVEKEMQDNPLLEEDIQQNEQSTGVSGNIDEDSQPKELWVTKPLSLHEHLLQQLRMSSASSEDIVIGEEIIGNIDDDGYLKASAEEISQSLNADVQKVNSMIQFIQGFEPAGIGARDLKECLLIQLGIKGKKDTVCWKIAENYLELCGKKQYAQIAKLLGVPLDTVKAGIVEIGKLEPKPGKLYSVEPNPHYVIPDIYIKKIDNEYYVAGNAFDIPVLKVNTSYEAILKDKNSDKQTRDYIREKMRAANFLIKCIRERQKTIHKIVENLVKEQDEFIEKGRSYLKPLTLKKVAQAIGRHQSTISRAIKISMWRRLRAFMP